MYIIIIIIYIIYYYNFIYISFYIDFASGSTIDWVKGKYNTRFVFLYELRDTGEIGFLLPPEDIIPVGEETLDSLVTLLDETDKITDQKQEPITKLVNTGIETSNALSEKLVAPHNLLLLIPALAFGQP